VLSCFILFYVLGGTLPRNLQVRNGRGRNSRTRRVTTDLTPNNVCVRKTKPNKNREQQKTYMSTFHSFHLFHPYVSPKTHCLNKSTPQGAQVFLKSRANRKVESDDVPPPWGQIAGAVTSQGF